MISARTIWTVNSRDFSLVQIRFEPDVLASYLHGYAALGPLRLDQYIIIIIIIVVDLGGQQLPS